MANGKSLQDFNSEQFMNRRKKDNWAWTWGFFKKSSYQYSMPYVKFKNKCMRDKKFLEQVKLEREEQKIGEINEHR
jgi:hypothetical protein